MSNKKITHFTDLVTWKEAHALVLKTYSLTKLFPKEELFTLTSQIRRSVVSITSNIAEGFSRSTSKDKRYFYIISKGSLSELDSQMFIAKDLGYISINQYIDYSKQSEKVGKLLSGLIKSASDKK